MSSAHTALAVSGHQRPGGHLDVNMVDRDRVKREVRCAGIEQIEKKRKGVTDKRP